ncbi:hypothetical protein P7K49_001271 [Saguinus oedipus]|uniref:Protein kinase domain-containing protein n=1 Tax=Saguinus oedipus TaxID=9490 RepID=A0ABQ9WE03_SAGOE|nr:hypothetical protein P7K49_001271 [Saguinus oedipus]
MAALPTEEGLLRGAYHVGAVTEEMVFTTVMPPTSNGDTVSVSSHSSMIPFLGGKELDHPNICRFTGGFIALPDVVIVMEYCPKGSLMDVLLNDDTSLNWAHMESFGMSRVSSTLDVAEGMARLHQCKMYRGKLKSTDYVIDGCWMEPEE